MKRHHQYCIFYAPFEQPANTKVLPIRHRLLDPWACFSKKCCDTDASDIHEWGYYPQESRFCLDQVPLDQIQYVTTATYNEKGLGFAWGFGADKKLVGRLGTIQLVNQSCNGKQLVPPVLILQLKSKVIVDTKNQENS